MHRRLASVPAILLVGLCGSAPATAAQPVPTAYTVTDLGTYGDYVNRATVGAMVTGRTSAAMGGFASAALAINATGHVVGGSVTGPLQRLGRAGTHAFLWTEGTMTDLGTLPGGSFSVAVGINVADQIAGDADVPGGEPHAVLWDHGSLIDLGMPPGYVRSHASAMRARSPAGSSGLVWMVSPMLERSRTPTALCVSSARSRTYRRAMPWASTRPDRLSAQLAPFTARTMYMIAPCSGTRGW